MSGLIDLAEVQLSKIEIIKSRAIAKNNRARAIADQITDQLDNIGKMSNAEKVALIMADPKLDSPEARAIEVMKLKSEGREVFIEHRGGNKWQRIQG